MSRVSLKLITIGSISASHICMNVAVCFDFCGDQSEEII